MNVSFRFAPRLMTATALIFNLFTIQQAKAASFTPASSMLTSRAFHTATLLPNGKVLVTGGYGDINAVNTSELYDPSTGIWTNTGSMVYARRWHKAILLSNGKVLVTGGYGYNNTTVKTTELYDPTTGTWTTTGAQNICIGNNTATLLTNGKVLVVGGDGWVAGHSAELYDPSTGTWATINTLGTYHNSHTATLLPNGRVLVAGGLDVNWNAIPTAELYDPTTGAWTNTGSMNIAVQGHTATLLPGGQVLVAGGVVSYDYPMSPSAQLYDPVTGLWTTTGSLNAARALHTATLLPNGNVLVMGGNTIGYGGNYVYTNSEIYDWTNKTWTLSGDMITSRFHHTATLLPNGQVLVTGGYVSIYFVGITNTAETYNDSLVLPPLISAQPQNQFTSVGSNATFSVTAYGQQPLNYQWFKNILLIPGATNATFTITNVQQADFGGYFVQVSNGYGQTNSATVRLAYLGQNTNYQSSQTTMDPWPARQPGKNNLILVTHGWVQSVSANPPAPDWISEMGTNLEHHIPSDWQVIWLSWSYDAWTTPLDILGFDLLPQRLGTVWGNAIKYGNYVGKNIAQQGWQNVHLIAHSIGSALIQQATDVIRSNAPPSTFIHETFLDPFHGFYGQGYSWYGKNADWSENYYSIDVPYTDGDLPNDYNADVTWLDPQTTRTSYINTGYSSDGTNVVPIQTENLIKFSRHEWPHEFYNQTITNTDPTWCGANYGFVLSKEHGTLPNLGSYPKNNHTNTICGQSPIVTRFPPRSLQYNLPSFDQIQKALSPNGLNFYSNSFNASCSAITQSPLVQFKGVQPMGSSQNAATNSPVWLALGLTITNPVNFVQFDAMFTDTNSAEGLLAVFWDTNLIGSVDERFVSPGWQTYQFFLPNTVTNSIYSLGFQLDSFNGTTSSITVTNLALGFLGTTTPLTLGILLTNATPMLQLTGSTNYNYFLESSTNLVDWETTALIVNASGTIIFPAPDTTNSATKFYRAKPQ